MREHLAYVTQAFQKAKTKKSEKMTIDSADSLVVTDPTTNAPTQGLTMGDRTGTRIFLAL